ncbi:hypothetical protein A3L11_03480 [Thermococcus siculi]|uniref:Glycosyltransferase RgtA/B/C/D-like domain-containing protein n=2 Tax=Thermococcus siculi TaxID=72803 RepID=A0A2Z2MLP5_9EURY|nr:hypothetical protein A3L11_03480 [Thermococcus siculi]
MPLKGSFNHIKIKIDKNQNLLILSLVLMFTGFLVVMLNKIFFQPSPPLIWDAATHYMDSVKYYISIESMNWKSMPYIDRYWPPLGPLIPVPVYLIFGATPEIGILTENALSIALLLVALYKLSEYFGIKTSIVATFVTLTSPIIMDQSITFMIDIPLTAVVAMEWYLLLKSEGFTDRRYTLLSALFFGLGILAKWTFIFFVIVPLLYELAIALHIEYHDGEIRIRPTLNILKDILIFSGVVVLVSGWWYIPNIGLVIRSILQNSKISGAIEGDPPIFSIKSALYYFFTAINFYLNPVIIGLFLASLGLLLIKIRKVSSYTKLVIGQLVFVYIVFTLTRNKDPRFLMPIIPFLGMIIGKAIDYLREFNRNKIFAGFIVILLFGGIMNVATFTKAIPIVKIAKNSNIVAISGGNLYLSGYYWSFNLNTTEDEWHIKEILSILEKDNRSHISMYVLSNNPVLTYPLRYRTINWTKTVTVIRPNTHELIPGQFSADYILYTQSESYSARWEIKHSTLARKLFIKYNNITKAFVPVREFEFPDGTKGTLYKRLPKVPVPSNTTNGDVSVTCQQPGSIFGNQVKLKAICLYQMEGIYLLEYHWEPLKDMESDYVVFVHITDENGNTVFQMDHKPCAGSCPTSTWIAGRDVIEVYYLRFPLAGCYQLRLGLWDPQKKERLPVNGNDDGHSRAVVGRICQTHSVKMLPPPGQPS